MKNTEYRKVKRLSPSSIISFLSNYKEWYNNYILGEKIPNNVYFEFGTAFHEMLEDFFNDSPEGSETIKEYTARKYEELWKKHFTENESLNQYLDEEKGITLETSEEWTYDYLKQWVKETLPIEKKYGSQKAFKFNSPSICEWHLEDEELKVHGYADAYYGKDKYNVSSGFLNFHNVEEEDPRIFGHLMSDYKTSKVDRNTNNTKYFLQCMIYALMFKRKNKRKSMNFVCVDYLKFNQKYYYYVSEDILSRMEKLIKDLWLVVEEINENPEKYFDEPPKKMKLKEYL